jgi:hypothetical protein
VALRTPVSSTGETTFSSADHAGEVSCRLATGGFVDLSLRFEDNETGHDDLVLRFANQRWVCDSYYLVLDRELLPDRENADKVRAVLLRLLEQWLVAVERLPDGGTAYLPYDFSDQYTGWLSCHRSGDEAVVSRGWANVEGWSFFPSAAGDLFHSPRGFRVDGPTVQGSVSELVEAVRGALA